MEKVKVCIMNSPRQAKPAAVITFGATVSGSKEAIRSNVFFVARCVIDLSFIFSVHLEKLRFSAAFRNNSSQPSGKMRNIPVYEDEREIIVMFVSTYGLQKHSNKGKPWQALNFQQYNIERVLYDKTILTRTFLLLYCQGYLMIDVIYYLGHHYHYCEAKEGPSYWSNK